jgi:L-asparaginase
MRLALIYTGGTIGCAGTPLKPLAAAEFQALWAIHVDPRLADAVTVDWQWLEPPLDSSQMSPAHWVQLARLVLDAREEEAVLLLHGTDTMAWSAAALAFLLTTFGASGKALARFGIPVVMTGAQRPLFEGDALRAGTDALSNVELAVQACREGASGVRVAFGGRVLPAARVMKMSTTADDTFDCPKGMAPGPALPLADPAALSEQLDRLTPHLGAKAVICLTPVPTVIDLQAAYLSSVIRGLGEALGAIHLNGFGIGSFPELGKIAPLLTEAHDRGVLIVAGSQVPYGDVDPSTYDSGHWMAGCGAMPSADMATAAVQVKLQLALALGAAESWNQVQMERFFQTPMAGELRG